MTANTIVWNSGWYSASNGQLMKTFVAYPVAERALGIGLKCLATRSAIHRAPDLLQGRSEIDLNLTSAVLTVNAFLPALKKSAAPHIVVVGSGYGWSPAGSAPLYSAAKAGLRAFVKSLRTQLRSSGMHVMEVVPPAVDTPGVIPGPGRRLAPSEIARVTLRGIDRGLPAVFAGQTRLLPFMLRIAPAALERMTLRD